VFASVSIKNYLLTYLLTSITESKSVHFSHKLETVVSCGIWTTFRGKPLHFTKWPAEFGKIFCKKNCGLWQWQLWQEYYHTFVISATITLDSCSESVSATEKSSPKSQNICLQTIASPLYTCTKWLLLMAGCTKSNVCLFPQSCTQTVLFKCYFYLISQVWVVLIDLL